jgi:hypothetical protein
MEDNLTKRNWQDNAKCCFRDRDEAIQYLFVECTPTKMIWRIVRISFGVSPPKNVTNLFGNWLNGLNKRV